MKTQTCNERRELILGVFTEKIIEYFEDESENISEVPDLIFGRASKTEPIVKLGASVSTDSVVAEGSSLSSQERLSRKIKRYLILWK